MVVYLAHHGIDGQKWGKRNGPPYPLDYEQHSAEQKKKNPKSELNNYENNNAKDLKSFSDNKLLDKIGLTKEDQKRLSERAKLLIAAGALVAGGATAYGIVRTKNINSDFTIGEGTDVFRIASSGDKSLQDVFYGATNQVDAAKYKGLYSTQKKMQGDDEIYQKIIKVKKDIKIAGKDSAEKVFTELLERDSRFKKDVQDILDDPLVKLNVRMRKPIGKISDYEQFNMFITQMDDSVSKKFYSALDEKGYGGVIDINDAKYSGYESKQPVIFFNHKDNVEVNSVRKIDSGEIEVNKLAGNLLVLGQGFLKNPTTIAIATGSIALGSVSTETGKEYVNQLFKSADSKEHEDGK